MGFNVIAPFEAETKLRQQLAAAAPQPQTGSRSAEISEYVAKLGKLYGHYLTTAQGSEPVALVIFQQSIEHFAL